MNKGMALAVTFLLSACSAGVNWKYPRVPSTAFTQPETTSVGALFQKVADRHPGMSGFYLVREGGDAFLARLAMIDLAEKTLDAQYYIWDGDVTGLILAEHIVHAAERGVRVRLLIDDHYLTTARDFRLATLAAHANIEVRFFNPVSNRGWRMTSFFLDFTRANHRMHNKLCIMDNALGIVGGRNIADVYFGVNTEHNYRDLDVLTAGPVVNELSAAFDQFWNSEWAVPVEATVRTLPTQDQLRAGIERLHERVAATGYPYPIYQDAADLRARLIRVRDRFVWAPGHAFVEKPSRVADIGAPRVIGAVLGARASKVKHELLIESPYFVLDQGQIERLRELKARGITVRALTNSTASNDVLPAQAGYANTRMKLLEGGLDLYELRPDSNMTRRWSARAARSHAALHAKTVVFDRESVWIGSFNLDPRSWTINTEIGVMIDSPEIAGQVAESMDEGVSAGSAYHVTLDDRGKLLWTAEKDGQVAQYHTDPGTTLWHRFKLGFVRLLPIESQI
jgi:cardiolipin synthase C